ncbi:MAG: winged helix-turn-helix domain-containing protein [Pseudomonadota bacterium]
MLYALNDLLIDTTTRTVRRGADDIRLPDLSFDGLVSLIEVAPQPLSTAELSHAVWRAEHVSDETVAQRIALLRKALGDDPREPKYIRTVRGSGYAIAGPVERVNGEPVFTPRRMMAVVTGVAALLFLGGLALAPRNVDQPAAELSTKTALPSTGADLIMRAKQQLGMHQSVETDRAISMLREALANDPRSYDARLTLSFALSTKATKFGGDYTHKQEAEALARELIEEEHDNSNAWSALGYSLGSQGRLDESLSALQYAYQLNPDNAPAASSAAHVHLLRGQLYQALGLEFEVLRAGGRSRYAEIQIAQSLDLIGHPAAEKWHAKALSLNPGQVVILSEIAKSHLRRGSPDAALETLAEAQGEDAIAPSILQLRGRANIALGRIGEAKRDLKAAGWRGQYDLAALEAIAGAPDLANELFTPAKLADLDSDSDPEFRIVLAEVAAACGRDSQAIRLLAQAVNLGWRDINWLKQSPFLGTLMASSEGLKLEGRIARELDAQRRLTEGNTDLLRAINS